MRKGTILFALIAVMTLLAAPHLWAQIPNEEVRPGAVGALQSLTNFERINLYNGRLSFNLPLLDVKGRGGIGYPLTLGIDKIWGIYNKAIMDVPYGGGDFQWVTHLMQMDVTYYRRHPFMEAAVLQGRIDQKFNGSCQSNQNHYYDTVSRLTFTLPDGSEHALRDELTEGKPMSTADYHCSGGAWPQRGKVYTSYEGSSITFVSDETLEDSWDNKNGPNVKVTHPSGQLSLPNGTHYRIDHGSVSWMRDRNGNQIAFGYTDEYKQTLSSITDSLGREVKISFDYRPLEDLYKDGDFLKGWTKSVSLTYTGFGGEPQTIRISYEFPDNKWLRSDFARPLKGEEAFPELDWSFMPMPGSVPLPNGPAFVELPDGKGGVLKYRFYYNPYGELARIELPTGGAVEYDWAAGPFCYPSGVVYDPGKAVAWAYNASGGRPWSFAGSGIYRRVVERRVYPEGGGTPAERTLYRKGYRADGWEDSMVEVEHVDPSTQATLSKEKHYFWGAPSISMLVRQFATDYPSWMNGREYKTEYLAADGKTVLRQVDYDWQQKEALGWWGPEWLHPLQRDHWKEFEPSNDTRVVEIKTTLADSGQIARKAFGYDEYNNKQDVYDYDFGNGAPGGMLRRVRTEFVKDLNGQNYADDPAIHLRNLPSKVAILDLRDGTEVEISRTEFEYDTYGNDGNHAGLADCPGIVGLDPGFGAGRTARGNATAVHSWLDTTGGYVSTYRQYDIAGNVVKVIDGRGKATWMKYGQEVQYAWPAKVSPPAPGKNGSAAAFSTSSVYDFWSGQVLSATDANGQTTTQGYDRLGRKISERRPDGGKTTIEYGDQAGDLYVRSLITQDDTILRSLGGIAAATRSERFNTIMRLNQQEQYVFYDGLKRPRRTAARSGDGSGWSITDAQYDSLGRAWRVANPYMATDARTPAGAAAFWTETVYDPQGRIASIITPDGAKVGYAYVGNAVTVTDQAGVSSTKITDALGRLVQVVQDPGGLDYTTDYTRDAQGNLRVVSQGGQKRNFLYDSLSRLIRAKNPEQEDNPALDLDDPLREKDGWSAAYAYDANGNLEQRIDARGVETTYRYDDLNRVIEVQYSDGQTPRVERFYDGAVNGKAKPWYALTYAAGGNTPLVKTTIDSYDAAGRLTALRRQFYQAGGWKDFGVKQGYNHVGAATVKEYPSGRGLDYTYDLQGRVSSVKGTLGDGSYRIYADEIRYTAAGQLAHERFGMVTPLYHNRHYNNRLQPYDIRLGTQETDPWTWNRGALQLCYASNYAYGDGGADNNGNPYRIGHFVPLNEAASDWAMAVMYYGYDPLNRIAGTAEARISAVDPVERVVYSQYYQYDPYGNRTIDPEKTTQHEKINRKLFSVDTATNRFKELGYDAAGNMTRDSVTGAGERIYDGENRMISAYGKGGWSSYAYDADGRRVKRSANGQEWWLIYGIGGELLAEYSAGAEPKQPFKEYGHRGPEMLVAAEAKKVKWHVADHLGTPRMIADATGSLAGMERHDYLPFGEEVPAGLGIREQKSGYGLDSSRQKFTGKERDDETGLDWFGPGRYYGALQGRFASTDPLNLPSLMRQDPGKFEAVIADPANWNGYVYAHNNPLSKQDPDGFLTIIIPGTWNDFNAWNTSAFKNWVKKSFGEDAVVWFWSGADNNGARSEAAKRLSDFINQYMQHHPGEKLNIVAHSHGGNVAFEATHKLNYKIDTLVTLGTPIRGDYTPNRSNIGRHFNVFTDLDPVQMSGGRLPFIPQMGGFGSLYGQFGPAGRRVSGPGVKNLDAWQYAGGWGEAHSNLWQNADVWNKLVEPALKK